MVSSLVILLSIPALDFKLGSHSRVSTHQVNHPKTENKIGLGIESGRLNLLAVGINELLADK